jgi:hypothetical protein
MFGRAERGPAEHASAAAAGGAVRCRRGRIRVCGVSRKALMRAGR